MVLNEKVMKVQMLFTQSRNQIRYSILTSMIMKINLFGLKVLEEKEPLQFRTMKITVRLLFKVLGEIALTNFQLMTLKLIRRVNSIKWSRKQCRKKTK